MTLIERLEAAEVGSRELDVEMWEATRGWNGVNHPPCFTTSLDAALALAERLNLNGPLVIHRNGPAEWGVTYVDDDTVYAPTPALALCIAILKAKETTS